MRNSGLIRVKLGLIFGIVTCIHAEKCTVAEICPTLGCHTYAAFFSFAKNEIMREHAMFPSFLEHFFLLNLDKFIYGLEGCMFSLLQVSQIWVDTWYFWMACSVPIPENVGF